MTNAPKTPTQRRFAGARTLRRTSLSLAVGFMISSVAYAQSSEGSIYGQSKASTAVTITSLDNGSTRTVQTDATGNFSLAKMAPGRYKITSNGVTREITVAIGSGTKVVLDAAQTLDQVEVTGRRTRSAIDVQSVESNTVFTQEQLQALPVPRNVNSVALLAPGVVKGDAGLGDGGIPSFGGASVAENGYYINGFDVTNIRNFLSYADLPFDAISEQQIKTGGYGAEYGRSLGGVISLATKRGTNEWKGGASIYWEPEGLRSKGKNVKDNEPEAAGKGFTLFAEDDTRSRLSTNFYAGGPLIKDKLFFFGLIEGINNTSTDYKENQATATTSKKPTGMIKLDFTPTDAHRFELTAINNKREVGIEDYKNAKPYSTSKDGVAAISTQTAGGDVLIAKYTGYLTDNLTVSALWGRVNEQLPLTTGARTAASNCPVVYVLPGTTYAGCWAEPFPGGGGRDPNAPATDDDVRNAFRFDIDYSLGDHTIRAGVDRQKFNSAEAGGSPYDGGQYFREFQANGVTSVAGVVLPAGTRYQRLRVSNNTSGTYGVENNAYYLEDSWRVQKNVLLYGGLRWESFDNKNGDGVSFVKKDNLLAPRVGFSWDLNGDSSLKVYGNAGRYFIPVASNTNIRATRGEYSAESYYTFNGRDPVTAKPLNLVQIGTTNVTSDGGLALPETIADVNLSPMSQDEYIIGFQKAVAKGWTAGVKYTHRTINNGMDDWCDPASVGKWANANGFPKFDYHTMAGCQLINPGRDVTLKLDLQNDGKLVPTTIPAAATGIALYTRKYDSMEFSFERAFDGKWGMSGSYTYSQSKGTAEGYVNSTIDQEDAGVSQDFDFGTFSDGSDGFLPNDRTHAIKLFGTYGITENFRIGANLNSTSGRPLSRIGFVPSTTPGDATLYNTASTYYYLNAQGVTVLGQRGSEGRTPWNHTLDLQGAYTYKMGKSKVTLQADIFNVLNSQEATEFSEINDFSRATTTVGLPGRRSLNYGNPTSFQTPRTVRLTARYEF
ncbi:MAG: Oar protein [Comamonadaceae bacterium PBBC2]|nr:MAG: Oar protein [Comamonadaceae bacterium PBBC2]